MKMNNIVVMLLYLCLQNELASRFKVTFIPSLIFVDGKTGELITKDGRFIIEDDPKGEQFPWRPKSFSEIVTDAKFIDKDKKEITWGQLQGKIIGFFFSGHPVSLLYTSIYIIVSKCN